MNENTVTIKVFEGSRKMLRIVAAEKDESQMQVIDRLLRIEVRKIERKKAKSK